ncbi:MAG: hypothetical protein LBI88_03535 [Deltaproteobacteria bacterium]|nr:hypothetical protein [Deltaproteobacteria bacterium]
MWLIFFSLLRFSGGNTWHCFDATVCDFAGQANIPWPIYSLTAGQGHSYPS